MIMIFDRLINYNDATGEFGPALATHWETADYQTFVFDLRDDVYFHNGEHFTANDVVYTVEMAREAAGSMMSSQWGPVATVTALSDYKLELVLSTVNVDFLMNLCQPQAGILNKIAVDSDPDFGPCVGTGAFILTDFATNDYVTVERNDNYWGTLPLTKSMTLRFIPEVSARTTMMLNGEVQACFSISSEDYGQFENDNFSIFPLIMNNPQGFSFNMQHPITGDRNFRLAVLHAMNRDDIALVAAGDWAWGISDAVGGEAMWGYATEFRNNNLPAYTQDLDLAREYLEASSYNGEPVEITASISTNIKSCEILQQQLAVIGINLVINETDTAGLNAQFHSPDHMMIFHGITFTYAAGSCQNVFLPGRAQNRGNYENAEVTALITEALGTTDRAAREQLYLRVQELVYEDMPNCNVLWRLNGIVACKGVGGIILPYDTHQTDLRGIYWIVD